MTQNFQQNDGKVPDKGPSPAGKDAGSGGPARRVERKPFSQRTVTLTMTWPRALFSAFFSLFVLVWVFIFGIMLGRGHNPEDVVPDLAKVMPAPQAREETLADGGVLQSRDLRYHETLKGKNAGDKPRAAPVTADPPKPAAQPERAAHTTAQAQQKPAGKPAAQPKPADKPVPPAKPAAPAAAASQDTAVYNYVYQVAAFNNAPAAEGMRKKLTAGGLSANVATGASNGVTWYRILVAFKGTPDDTRKLREKLSVYGISHIILREKSPEKRGTP